MVVKRERRREHNPVRASSDGAQERAESLAPPEERADRSANQSLNGGGVMVVGTGELKLPDDFTEREDKNPNLLGLDSIALIILIFALAFIAFIAYLISIEPTK